VDCFRFSELMRETLVRLFDVWMASTGESATVASKKFAGDGSFYARLPHNRPTVKVVDPIIQKFSDAWPENVAWPVEFPSRPPAGKWDDLLAEISKPGGKARRLPNT